MQPFIEVLCKYCRTCSIIIIQVSNFISRLLISLGTYQQISTAELLCSLLMNKIIVATYNLPTTTELAVILLGDSDQPTTSRDIVLFRTGSGIQKINDLHPFYPALHYVLLFATGQLQWHLNIPYRDVENPQQPQPQHQENNQGDKRKIVTQSEYLKYCLHPCLNESNHIFMAKKLFQEYVVDGWATTEQSHLDWVQRNKTKIRAYTYKGLTDALAVDPQMYAHNLGQRIVLPSTFINSSGFMIHVCQEADFFLTMTANPNWPEIKAALLPGQSSADRPDLVNCVFCLKVQELMDDIHKQGVLRRAVAHVWTTEFQKRGLPHVHLIIFLYPDSKLSTAEEIDSLLSADFPDEDEQHELFELVKQFMVHTPCDAPNSNAHVCIMESVQKTFLSPLEITPLSMRTHMLISGEETLAKSIKSEVRRLITDGLFLNHHTGFGSLGVISIWSVFSQSDASSTSTSMSTRAMIAQLWSLADVKIK